MAASASLVASISSASASTDRLADHVDVALVELPVPALLRPFRPPHRSHLQRPERQSAATRGCSRRTGQRHRQVVPQPEVHQLPHRGPGRDLGRQPAPQHLEDQLLVVRALAALQPRRCSPAPGSRSAGTRTAGTPPQIDSSTWSRTATSAGSRSRIPLAGLLSIFMAPSRDPSSRAAHANGTGPRPRHAPGKVAAPATPDPAATNRIATVIASSRRGPGGDVHLVPATRPLAGPADHDTVKT